MSLLKYIALATSLVALSTAALAFQEQTSGGNAPAVAQPTAKPVELNAPGASGLGKLGSLPKMDFGLELLYGASETKTQDVQPLDDARDDLTIRGSVKHKF